MSPSRSGGTETVAGMQEQVHDLVGPAFLLIFSLALVLSAVFVFPLTQ